MKIADETRRRRTEMFINMPPLKKSLANLYRKNGEITVVVPVYRLLNNFSKRQEAEVKGYIKRAFWLAYEFSKFGGLLETNTDFYIATHTDLRTQLEPYRQLCEFPESQIFQVQDVSMFLGYMPNVHLLHSLCKTTKHKYFIRADTSLYFRSKHPLLQGVDTYWQKHPTHIIWASLSWNKESKERLDKAIKNKAGADFEKISTHLPKYLGFPSMTVF